MTALIKNQNFGIEVELTGITRKQAAEIVAKVLGSNRITGPANNCYHVRKVYDSEGRAWIVERDSSISPELKDGSYATDEHRVEFVSPILQYKDIETHQAIIREFRKAGAIVNKVVSFFKSKGGDSAKSTVTSDGKKITVTDGTTSIQCDADGNCSYCPGGACEYAP